MKQPRAPHRSRREEKLAPWLFIAPFVLAFFIFFLFPLLYSLVLSFMSYKGYGAAKFVGFENYLKIFRYKMFWQTMKNTLIYYISYVVPLIVISFMIALLLNEKLIRPASKVIKPLLFIPQIVPVVAASLIFKILLSTRSGALNNVLGTRIPFLEDAAYMRWCTLALMLWRGIGWYMVVFSAGLTGVNTDLLEAASIDGAGFWKRLIHVTIPVMKPIFLFAFIMNSINTFKLYTEPTVLLTLSTVNRTASPVMSLLIQNVKNGNFGIASAIGWVLFIAIMIVTVLYFKVLGREDDGRGKRGATK